MAGARSVDRTATPVSSRHLTSADRPSETRQHPFEANAGPMSTTHFNTKERILGAAEELFAQHGFAVAVERGGTRGVVHSPAL